MEWKEHWLILGEQIHILKSTAPEDTAAIADQIPKLMHRFTEEEVERLMDRAEKEP